MNQTIQEKIKQRRRQMYVHSYIYYELNQNIVSDHTWAKWAKELADLQKKYPNEAAEVEYADDFKNWDGSSGAFLNFPEFTKTVAHRLLKIKMSGSNNIMTDFVKISQKSTSNCQKKSKVSASRKLF